MNKSPELTNVVVLGGGSGSSALLEGLSHYDLNLTSVVNVIDNGGSSGELRQKHPGLIGVGDLRQCMRALANDKEEAFRFDSRREDGHAVGNLAIVESAIEAGGIQSIEQAIEVHSDRLQLTGLVIPVSLDDSHLRLSFPLTMKEPEIVGEEKVSKYQKTIRDKYGILALYPEAQINPRAEQAIVEADCVIIAPGNFYSSIIPTLLTKGLKEAAQAARGNLVMVGNLENCPKTAGFTTKDYIDELYRQTKITPDLFIAHKKATYQRHEMVPIISADLADPAEPTHDPNDKISDQRSRLLHDGKVVGSLILTRHMQAA